MKIFDKITLVTSILSLLVSFFVAYKQFQPVKDSVDIEGVLRFSEVKPIKEIYRGSRLTKLYGENKAIGGPFELEITLSNNLNRSVSIKNISVNYFQLERSFFYHSLIRKEELKKLNDVIKIDSNGVERRTFSVNLPFYMSADTRKCLDNDKHNSESNESINLCYYKNGLDIFGNKIRYAVMDGAKMAILSKDRLLPEVIVRLTTGDNTIIKKKVTFNDVFPADIEN